MHEEEDGDENRTLKYIYIGLMPGNATNNLLRSAFLSLDSPFPT